MSLSTRNNSTSSLLYYQPIRPYFFTQRCNKDTRHRTRTTPIPTQRFHFLFQISTYQQNLTSRIYYSCNASTFCQDRRPIQIRTSPPPSHHKNNPPRNLATIKIIPTRHINNFPNTPPLDSQTH